MRECYINTEAKPGSPEAIGICSHKALLSDFQAADLWLTLFTFLVISLSAPTGTGGGGILTPMYIILGGFTTHSAIPLSKATIFGGAVINNIINIPRRHPFANRPLIAYDLVFIMGPAVLTGAVIGVLFNAVSPAFLLGLLLTVVLAYSTYSASRKAWDIYQLENKAEAEEEKARLLPGGGQMPGQHYSFGEQVKETSSDRLKEILEAEQQADGIAVGLMCTAWLFITLVAMLKANSLPGQPEIACGGWAYWLIAFVPLPVFAWTTWAAGTQAAQLHEEKVAWGYRFSEGDMQWTRFNVRLYPLLAFAAGVTAGSLGIAAGMLLSPFFLELGVVPLVGMATTSLFVMFTSSSTSVQYIFLGQLKMDYAIYFCLVGGVGAAFGNVALNALVERYRKAWFLVAIMALLLLLSMFLMSWMAWLDLSHQVSQDGYSIGFRDICSAEL